MSIIAAAGNIHTLNVGQLQANDYVYYAAEEEYSSRSLDEKVWLAVFFFLIALHTFLN